MTTLKKISYLFALDLILSTNVLFAQTDSVMVQQYTRNDSVFIKLDLTYKLSSFFKYDSLFVYAGSSEDSSNLLNVRGKFKYSSSKCAENIDFGSLGTACFIYNVDTINGKIYESLNLFKELYLGSSSGNIHVSVFMKTKEPNAVYTQRKRFFFDMITSTNHFSLLDLSLAPNPTTGVVRLNNLPDGLKTLQIVNLQGAVLKEENSSANTTELDLSALPTGVYFVTLSTETGQVFTGKIVKQ